jgi:hypothetical protein
MTLSLSRKWRHDPELKAIMFEADRPEAASEQMGIKIDALVKINEMASGQPVPMGQIYLDNHARIEGVAIAVLEQGRRRHKSVTMLFTADFAET